MKIKVATNDENYKQVVLGRAKTICWVSLFVCFTIKIFGGDFFNILCEHENFARFCNFIDNHIVGKIILGFISTFICNTLFYLAICRKLKLTKLETIIVIILSFIFVVFRVLLPDLSLIPNILQYFVIPFFIKRGNKVLCKEWFIRTLIYGNILNFGFQIISMFVKSLAISLFQ